MLTFTLERSEFEDGKGKCPYDPAKGHTGLLVGECCPIAGWGSPGLVPTLGPRGLSVCTSPLRGLTPRLL